MAKRNFGIVAILFVTLFSSCTPQRRIARIIERHPEAVTLEEKTFVDTFYIQSQKIDTVVYVPIAKKDSALKSEVKEAITLKIGSAKAHILPVLKGDSLELSIEVEQQADTAVFEHSLYTPTIEVVKKAKLSGWQKFFHATGLLFWSLLLLFVLLGVLSRFAK